MSAHKFPVITPEDLRLQALRLRPVHRSNIRSMREVPSSRLGVITDTPRSTSRVPPPSSATVRSQNRLFERQVRNEGEELQFAEWRRRQEEPEGLFSQVPPSFLPNSPSPLNPSAKLIDVATPPPSYHSNLVTSQAAQNQSMPVFSEAGPVPTKKSRYSPQYQSCSHQNYPGQPSAGGFPQVSQNYQTQSSVPAQDINQTFNQGQYSSYKPQQPFYSAEYAMTQPPKQPYAEQPAHQFGQPSQCYAEQPAQPFVQPSQFYAEQPAHMPSFGGSQPQPFVPTQPVHHAQPPQPQRYPPNPQNYMPPSEPGQQYFPQQPYAAPSQPTFGNLTRLPQPVDLNTAALMASVVKSQNDQTRCLVSRQSQSSKLHKFGGNPLDWPLFYHRYQQSTIDCNYSPSENVARLCEALIGDARRYVEPLLIMPNSNPYYIICKLQQRFGKPQYIIQSLVETVRRMPAPKESKLNTILDFASGICNLVMTIKSLEVDIHLHNPQLLRELVDKLPDSLKLQWGTVAMVIAAPSLENFSSWIDNVASAASFVTMPDFTSTTEGKKKTKGESLFTTTTADKENAKPEHTPSGACYICKSKDHNVDTCLKKLSVDERWERVKQLRLCFRCLRPRCNVYVCRSKKTCQVDGCSRRHHPLLHGSSFQRNAEKNEKPKPAQDVNGCVNECNPSVLLRILPVTLHGPGGEIVVNALLDEASTVTMLSEDVAKKLKLPGALDPLRLNWTDGSSQVDNSSRKVKCHISRLRDNVKFSLEGIRTVKNLNLPAQFIDHQAVVSAHKHLKGVKLQVLPEVKPVLLIGQPHIHLTLARSVMEGCPSAPVATETRLGWVLHGPTGGRGDSHHTFVCYHETDSEIMHRLVKESFSLESVGVRTFASLRSRDDIEAEKIMEAVTKRVGERWETGLLWRNEPVMFSAEWGSQQKSQEAEEAHCTATFAPVGGTSTTVREEKSTLPVSSVLPPSYATAYRRLQGVEKRLAKSDILRDEYQARVEDYVKKGYARKLSTAEAAIPNPKQWFLPTFPVFNPNKPGKMRMVFDAASHSHGKSLNDFLFTGPDLLVSLPGLLLNFRLRKIAFSGDITEMFHQVLIRKEDQPSQRFLWRNHPSLPPDVYQLQVMMFGSVCSPYCAQFVKNRNAEEYAAEHPDAVAAIKQKHYMDDYIDCTDTEEEAKRLIKEVTNIHRRGGFHIGKWISNSTAVLESIKPEDRVAAAKDLSCWSEIPTERALGLHWSPSEDCFLFKLNLERAGKGVATGDVIPTKRAILRLVMLVWDPLGVLNHFMIKARILLQQVWRSKIGWDDEIPASLFDKWRTWVKRLPQIEKVRIPRCYSAFVTTSKDVQLHVFADASELAYCAVAYLRIVQPNGEISTAFLISKSRVAPLKPASIPRLELQAAVIASRLGKFIVDTIEVAIHSVTYWTDSATVLKWIRSEARRYQQFVSNRIGEIHENSDVSRWRWVPTKLNVADDATRDGKCDISNDSRWWRGPEFLLTELDDWPEEEDCAETKEDLELRNDFAAVAVQSVVPDFSHLPDLNRFSNYMRIVRATAYVLLACEKFKWKSRQWSELPMKKAELLLFQRSQWEDYPNEMSLLSSKLPIPKSSELFRLSVAIDNDGLMRMQSRLEAAPEGLRSPIILHKQNTLVKMLISCQHAKAMHQGETHVYNELRQRYWIRFGKAAVRDAIRKCAICKLKKLKSTAPMMGSLPDFRITRPSRAFTYVGLDYFGPWLVSVKRSQVKVYGVIFTCLSTRAIHLELANDLSTDACIMAIRRMIARRGEPSIIWSDNGTNLKGACAELKKCLEDLNQDAVKDSLAVKGVVWKFTPPHGPHFGACWERMVRTVKSALLAVLKTQTPKEDVLHTLLTEVEAIVNSRPLTDVPIDPEAPEALTPFHFLIGTSSTRQPPGVFDDKDLLLRKRWRRVQVLADRFWIRWVREYLPTLQQRRKWNETRPNIRVGDVVVLFDESLRRGAWPMGIVSSTFPGKDGVVRVVEVRTATGVYKRPVVMLAPIGVRPATDTEEDFGGNEGEYVAGEFEVVREREEDQKKEQCEEM